MEEKKKIVIGLVPTSKGNEIMLKEGYEIKQDGEKFYVVKKQPQYPKTYEECCKVLGIHTSNGLLHDDSRVILAYKIRLVACLQELLICRDAYWKVAGDWKPDWEDSGQEKYVLYCYGESLEKTSTFLVSHILAFPTEELRDAFYENFKDLIESCKELL